MLRPILLTLLWGCAGPQQNLAASDVELFTDDAKLTAVGMDHIELSLPFELHNKGAGTTTLDAVSWRLEVPSEIDTRGHATPALTIAPGQQKADAITVRAALDASDAAFARRDSATRVVVYTVTATFQVSGSEYQASWNGELLLPVKPSVHASAQAVRNDKSVDMHFLLAVKNPNPFPLSLSELAYVLRVEGKEIDRGTVGTGQKVAQGSEVQFDLTRNGSEELSALQSLHYEIDATLSAAGVTYNQPLTGTIEFAK